MPRIEKRKSKARSAGAAIDPPSEAAADRRIQQQSRKGKGTDKDAAKKRARPVQTEEGDGGSRVISDDNRAWLSFKQKKKGSESAPKKTRKTQKSEAVLAQSAVVSNKTPKRKSDVWDSESESEGESESESEGGSDSDDLEQVQKKAAVPKTKKGGQLWSDSDSHSGSDDEFGGGLDDVDSSLSSSGDGGDSGQEWLRVDGEGAGSDDDSDSDSDGDEQDEEEDEFITPLERKARRAQQKAALMATDAAAELRDQLRRRGGGGGSDDESSDDLESDEETGPKMLKLPSGAGILESALASVDITEVNERMQVIIRVLANFAENRETGRARSEYLSELAGLMATYYGYSDFLVLKFLELFGPAECLQFLEANERPRPVTVRANTLKSRRRDVQNALTSRGVTLEQISWSPIGITIHESNIPIGATPEYLAGHYMLQSASSFLPVMALDPQENERILDMCAAPGGKTTHIAQMMNNSGSLFANDVNRDRCKALFANIHRLGVRNTILSNCDGREFPRVMGGFDRILLDAPCTGFGVISKDPSVKTQKSQDDLDRMTKEQKELILAAIDSIDHRSKTGGFLVYSTCSVSVEENEAVIDYALKKRHVSVVECGLEFGVPGLTKYMHHRFHPSLNLSRRYYPHTHNLDGFFVCKLKKLSDQAQGAHASHQEGDVAAVRSTVPDVRVGPKKLKVKRKERRELKEKKKQYAAATGRRGTRPSRKGDKDKMKSSDR